MNYLDYIKSLAWRMEDSPDMRDFFSEEVERWDKQH